MEMTGAFPRCGPARTRTTSADSRRLVPWSCLLCRCCVLEDGGALTRTPRGPALLPCVAAVRRRARRVGALRAVEAASRSTSERPTSARHFGPPAQPETDEAVPRPRLAAAASCQSARGREVQPRHGPPRPAPATARRRGDRRRAAPRRALCRRKHAAFNRCASLSARSMAGCLGLASGLPRPLGAVRRRGRGAGSKSDAQQLLGARGVLAKWASPR